MGRDGKLVRVRVEGEKSKVKTSAALQLVFQSLFS